MKMLSQFLSAFIYTITKPVALPCCILPNSSGANITKKRMSNVTSSIW